MLFKDVALALSMLAPMARASVLHAPENDIEKRDIDYCIVAEIPPKAYKRAAWTFETGGAPHAISGPDFASADLYGKVGTSDDGTVSLSVRAANMPPGWSWFLKTPLDRTPGIISMFGNVTCGPYFYPKYPSTTMTVDIYFYKWGQNV
ncbi:hypothetical protein ACJQWK_01240 [Exserohilum turcicum]|uniref:Uncharacterized protein n=1 Tax=Exserohilum turcicum (strain 28A) TaxID=671987 RepID=R0K723_EXST2|nr:uncharacterized protein SETTUDRAFT_21439 [Exserohilum turcica Et28A]EOA84082.1 hypothetical protein SETTUDRAFT_21439 [Exserohilum turcica Et28A]